MTSMNSSERLSGRLHKRDIQLICLECSDENVMEELLSLSFCSDNRIAYNALWVLTHLNKSQLQSISNRRNQFIERILTCEHTGIRRLSLTILDRMTTTEKDIRTDFLDFCLTAINSPMPYAIRALCLKQAFAMCRFYPELIEELRRETEIMTYQNLSPGLRAAKRNIELKISRLNQSL